MPESKPVLNISSKNVLDGSPDPGADAVWDTMENAASMKKRDGGNIDEARFAAINSANPDVGKK